MSMRLNIHTFVKHIEKALGGVALQERLDETQRSRVRRRFTRQEVLGFLNIDASHFTKLGKLTKMPEGEKSGRERLYTADDIMRMRVITAAQPGARKKTLFWRSENTHIPIITLGSLKGGSGKSISSAHLAQHANLAYGLRVGLIDADPQATLSLYFSDDKTKLLSEDTPTFADFIGVPEAGIRETIMHSPDKLDSFWQSTPWPGIRLMPGGPSIQAADIALFFLGRGDEAAGQPPAYALLRSTIQRWSDAHQPKSRPQDLLLPDGSINEEAYQAALRETVDLIIIDTAPSMTLSQIGAIYAADSLVICQTMRGFDISTLKVYASSIGDYFDFIKDFEKSKAQIGQGPNFVLPTIVGRGNDTDINQLAELYTAMPSAISPVFYFRSDAVANAAEQFKSFFEFEPIKSRRESAAAFIANAKAVGDYILPRVMPNLGERGYARAFIEANWDKDMIVAGDDTEAA